MKKNFLFKGVLALGAMLLLANVTLPGLVAYAENEEPNQNQEQQQEQQNNNEEQNQQEEPEVQGCEGSEVVEIGENKYCTLKEAFEKAKEDDTIKLLKDVAIDETGIITVDKKITLDMNTKTITYTPSNTVTKTTYVQPITISSNGDLTIKGNGTINGPQSGETYDGKVIISVDGGKLTYVNGTLKATGNGSDGMYGVYVLKSGTAIFGNEDAQSGPTIESHFAAIGTNNTTAPANITVYGGTYEAKASPSNNDRWSYFCAPIYAAAAGNFNVVNANLNGYYGISTRYANVEQSIELGTITFTSSSSTNVFIDKQSGSTSDSNREIVVKGGNTAPNITVPASYKWVKDGNDWKLGHTVTFTNDSTSTTVDVVDTKTVEQPENPTKENYEFVAWYNGDAEFNFDTPILADTTLTAKWGHKVTFDVDGEKTEVLVVTNTTIGDKKPGNPTKDGFAFKHWAEVTENETVADTAFNFSTSITANKTLKAVWVKAIDVDNISFKKLVIGEDYSHKNDTYFTNISTNNSKFDLSYDKENKILTITDKGLSSYQNSTSQNKKWIGVIADFGTEVKGTGTEGDYGVEDVDRTDAASWGANGTEFIMWLSEARDGQTITLKNTGSENDSVSFKLIFKTLDESKISFDTLTIKDANPKDSNYENIVTNNSKFEPVYNQETKTLTIKDNGLVKYDNGTNYGSNEKAEYKWIGVIADFGASVEGVEGGYGVAEEDRTDALKWADDVSNNAFVMWLSDYRNGQEITLKKQGATYSNDSITFKLVFEETVTFESNGGSSVEAQKVTMGETAAEPSSPTRSNYTFKGWYSDKDLTTAYDFSTPVNDNITLYAKWEQNKSSGGSSSGGGGGSSKSSTKADTKANTGDTAKVDDAKTDNKVADNKVTDNNTNVNDNTKTPAYNDKYSKEFNDAYQFAYKYGITTMPSIEEADMESPLTRIAMAKMLSQYAINILGKTPDTNRVVPNFPDVDAQLDADYNNGVTLAYQLGIMGIGIEKFRPFDLVTRAEFGTALSRMLYGLADGDGAYYETHLAKLMEEQIITNNNPDLQELRGYVMIMLMRSAQK